MATSTLDVTSVVSATGSWSGATQANLSSSNDVRATGGDASAGDNIIVEITNVPGDFSAMNTIQIHVEGRKSASGGRSKQFQIELLNSSDTQLETYTSGNITTTDATYQSSAFSRSDNSTTIDGYRIRVTCLEGGGMPGGTTHEIDRIWATLDYSGEVTADSSFTLADVTVSSDGDVDIQADSSFTLDDATISANATDPDGNAFFQITNGSVSSLTPSTGHANINGILGTTIDYNPGSGYSWSNTDTTVTIPSSGLADGYLILYGLEFEDTTGGKIAINTRVLQSVGTGSLTTSHGAGASELTSERCFVNGWAFCDNPSASSQFKLQWRKDSGSPNTTDGPTRSFMQVIPLYYADAAWYTSTNTTTAGGTTPAQITGFTGTDGTNITISTDTVSVTGDNKRYLCLGSTYFNSLGGTVDTLRWTGFRVDGTKDDAAKGCATFNGADADENGSVFMHLIETVTATRTIDIFEYRGDGTAAGQGGATTNGQSSSFSAEHAMVILELHDSAEVWHSDDSVGGQELALTGPVDIDIASTGDITFNDSAAFTRSSDTAVNCEKAMNVLAFANIGNAREASGITSSDEWSAHAEFTINGGEQTAAGFHGDFNKGENGTQDCFGSSQNPFGAFVTSSGDDIGVSVQEVSGSAGGGGDIETQPGWIGFGLINLDSLQDAGNTGASAFTLDDFTIASTGDVDIQADSSFTLDAFTTSSDGSVDIVADSSFSLDAFTVTSAGSVDVQGETAFTLDTLTISSDMGVEVQGEASNTIDDLTIASAGVVDIAGTSAITLDDFSSSSQAVIDIEGDGALTLDTMTITSTGDVDIVAEASNTLDDFTVSSTGSIGATATGDLSVTLDDYTISSGSSVFVDGDSSFTLDDVSVSSAGVIDIAADSAITLNDFLISAATAVDIQGDTSFTIDTLTIASDAGVDVQGELSITLDDFTISASADDGGGSGLTYTPLADYGVFIFYDR